MSAKHESSPLASPEIEATETRDPVPIAAPKTPVIVRRRFLIDGMQTRPVVLITVLTLVLLVLLNLAFYHARTHATETRIAQAPHLESKLQIVDRVQIALVIAGSVIFLAGVFLVTLLETHKTAGAVFNLARRMQSMRDGDYGVRLRLRSDDNLKSVERVFNETAGLLESRLVEDTETFEQLAAQAEQVTGVDDALALADRLSDEAMKRRIRWQHRG
jgi:methyl-accepting chemotaxis protein